MPTDNQATETPAVRRTELLACPFCGSRAEYMRWHGAKNPNYAQKVGCYGEGSRPCAMQDVFIPIEQWQTRHANDKVERPRP